MRTMQKEYIKGQLLWYCLGLWVVLGTVAYLKYHKYWFAFALTCRFLWIHAADYPKDECQRLVNWAQKHPKSATWLMDQKYGAWLCVKFHKVI